MPWLYDSQKDELHVFMCAFDNPADACDGNNGHTVQSKSIKLPIMDIIQMPGDAYTVIEKKRKPNFSHQYLIRYRYLCKSIKI